ncbi:dTDP-glucose 4,6-dehydratase [Paenibacillus ihbetae]|uniref:dTDP-glucose 4,6-dehydratase n=1 Tax=Paenibacillus ihbetae TaxID=1870820 RepID=A0ABX3JS81_9BACL|nr:dTDP-glucose 4,6-dehydratase [Paenibacillus ihbetae]OOC59295.1 dTDP-glucose 4,6-dehydratase [Paenibacillus ihbetae]
MSERNLLPDDLTILITGGAGFVGSNFLRLMLLKYPSYCFVNMDKLTYSGNINNLADFLEYPNYSFIHGDICDRALVDSIVEKHDIDVIINFAAESHVDRSIKDPLIFVKTNINGTQSLLDAGLKHNIKLFLQISTDEVYGSLDDTGYFTEASRIAPNNPYSASKASADMLISSYGNTYGLPFNIVRFGNTYGPFQYPEKLIPMAILNALHNQPIPIHGKGQSIRDWVYVKDNNSAIDRVLHFGRRGEVYNIGSNQEKRTIEVVHLILEMLKKPNHLIEFVEDRPGQDYRYANNPHKIMSELGWMPQYNFLEGLQTTIQWYIEHMEWWGTPSN